MKNPKGIRALLGSAALICMLATAQYAVAGSGGFGPGTKPDGGAADDGGGGSGSGNAVFPVQAKHTYGDGIGAGRGHQGQDVLAKCGSPVVAAESGRVLVDDYQASGAGNYIVIGGNGKGAPDLVYMHLLKRVDVRKGDRVEAGDSIGSVGSTGRSTACHLHFEIWSAPGWYKGGSPQDPRPYLKGLDRDAEPTRKRDRRR